MCNCLEEKKKLVMDTGATKIDSLKSWEIEEVEFKHNTELFLSALNIPIVVKGTNGRGKEAKKELYYPAIYCPFCGEKFYKEKCTACGGSGRYRDGKCGACGGTGTEE